MRMEYNGKIRGQNTGTKYEGQNTGEKYRGNAHDHHSLAHSVNLAPPTPYEKRISTKAELL